MCSLRASPHSFNPASLPGGQKGNNGCPHTLVSIDAPSAEAQEAVNQDHGVHIFPVDTQGNLAYEDCTSSTLLLTLWNTFCPQL